LNLSRVLLPKSDSPAAAIEFLPRDRNCTLSAKLFTFATDNQRRK
jgi:hypothetical protein